ncbi:MAG: lipopolysaccharide export system protein LptC [Rhodothermales bacterium]|jgi:lipopolysaccharide export system protein LptC
MTFRLPFRLALTLFVIGAFSGVRELDAQTVVVVRGVPAFTMGAIDAADFDGDGDRDLVIVGQKLDGAPVTGVFKFNARLVEPIPLQAPRIVADYSRPLRT